MVHGSLAHNSQRTIDEVLIVLKNSLLYSFYAFLQ